MTTSKTTMGTPDFTMIKKVILKLQENKNSMCLESQVTKWYKILDSLTNLLDPKSNPSIGSIAFQTLLAKHNISYDKNELQKANVLRNKISHCVLFELQSHDQSLFLQAISTMESICSLILCKYEQNTKPPTTSKKKKRNKKRNNKKKKNVLQSKNAKTRK